MELLAVVAVIAIVAGIAVSRIGAMAERSRDAAAAADLATIRDAMLDIEAGYLRDMSGLAGFSAADMRLANLVSRTNIYVVAEAAGGKFPRARALHLSAGLAGIAPAEAFAAWDAERGRGWRGPYVHGKAGVFPARDAIDGSFYPDVSRLYVPEDFANRRDISIYGIPGEPAMLDPWGRPYVLQVPPPQAFTNSDVAVISPEMRFAYARLVCAGADGKIDTPCFYVNRTNDVTASLWLDDEPRLSRQAGLFNGDDKSLRGDDIVLFIQRNDIDER